MDDYDSYIEKAIVSYMEWIAIIENQKPNAIIRLEFLEEDVLQYFDQQSIFYNKTYDLNKISKYNSTKDKHRIDKPVLSKQNYLNIDPKIICQINSFCNRYGYSTDFF